MMLKVVPPLTAADEIRRDCIRILRAALEQAENGDVSAVLVVLEHPNGRWSDERSAVLDMSNWIGKISIIKQGWINSYLGEQK